MGKKARDYAAPFAVQNGMITPPAGRPISMTPKSTAILLIATPPNAHLELCTFGPCEKPRKPVYVERTEWPELYAECQEMLFRVCEEAAVSAYMWHISKEDFPIF